MAGRPFSTRLERALRRAAEWHAGQTRKGSATPYVTHAFAVAWLLDRFGFDEDVLIAGLLHDAVEDTDATLEEIAAAFGPRVADLVGHCSERKADEEGQRRPWLERKTEHVAHLAAAPLAARAVALADKLHNLLSIQADLEAGVDVWAKFNAGREQVLWYQGAMIDACAVDAPELAGLAKQARAVLEVVSARPNLGY